jgi:DNA-binding response OmpR family regulator
LPSRLYGKSILLIEDEEMIRSQLKQSMTSVGCKRLRAVANIELALEAIAAEPFDLILCDYNLGDNTNGQQFLEYIRTRELISRNTLFIMITAEQTYQNVMLVAECTPDGYLLKPFTPAQLNARVNRLIARQEELEYVNRAVDLRRWDKAISESNKHTDAMEVLHKAGEQSPGTLGRLRTLTSLAIGAGQNDVAEQVMTNALKVNKHSPVRDVGDFALLSRALLNQNKSAAEALAKANAGDLTNVPLDVALTVAEANLVLGREAEAHNLIKQAIQNNPDGSNLMQKVMTALGGKNKAEQAAAIIAASQREIIQLNNEGVRKAEAGQFDQAIALLSSAADRLPNNLQIVGNAALALAQHMVRHGVDSERLNICLRYRNSLARQSPEDPKLRQIDTNLQRLKR